MSDDLTPPQERAVRLALKVAQLQATLDRVELLAATWEGDSIGTDRFCAAELRAALAPGEFGDGDRLAGSPKSPQSHSDDGGA